MTFCLPYDRPLALSLLWKRLGGHSSRELEQLLARPTEQLTPEDFAFIFYVAPAGDHREIGFFVPPAIEFARKNAQESFEFIEDLVKNIGYYRTWYEQDNVFDAIVNELRSWFEATTSSFTVAHHDADFMQRMGSHHPYADIVINSQVLRRFVQSAVECKRFPELLNSLSDLLRLSPSWAHAMWYLEFWRHEQDEDGEPSGFLRDGVSFARERFDYVTLQVSRMSALPPTFVTCVKHHCDTTS